SLLLRVRGAHPVVDVGLRQHCQRMDPEVLAHGGGVFGIERPSSSQHLKLRNEFIKQVFGRYVTDDVVESLLNSPKALELGGQKREVTILMSDLRGFTSLAERLTPERVVEVLNIYLGAMAEVIDRYRGVIDEFIGDAVLALFGAPVVRENHAERAVACALAMQLAMDGVNAQLRELNIPPLEMGIGVNTGEVIVGNIGSLQRAKYGAVGSQVNLASRIQSATVGREILISAATARHLQPLLELQREVVFFAKGMSQPMTLYSVTGLRGAYQLRMPAVAETFSPLACELAVECFHLNEAKLVNGAPFAGWLTALSPHGGLLKTAEPLATRSDLKLSIPSARAPDERWDVYAKVMDAPTASTSFPVRFTSLPPHGWPSCACRRPP
ncbi:MAG: adenylate/guanylate cyclase domain-containing protein, partial [Verrucomicrobiota bacterium]